MTDIIAKIGDIIQVVKKNLVVIIVVAAVFSFMPIFISDALDITNVISQYKPYISISLIISICFWLVINIPLWLSYFIKGISNYSINKKIEKELQKLEEEEKYILMQYLHKHVNVLYFNQSNEAAISLVYKGILQTNSILTLSDRAFYINMYAFNYLLEHIELIIRIEDILNDKQ